MSEVEVSTASSGACAGAPLSRTPAPNPRSCPEIAACKVEFRPLRRSNSQHLCILVPSMFFALYAREQSMHIYGTLAMGSKPRGLLEV